MKAIQAAIVLWTLLFSNVAYSEDDQSFHFGHDHSSLKVGIAIKGKQLSFALRNSYAKPISVMTHISTHERHYDGNMILHVIDSEGVITQVRFSDSRDASTAIFATLKPGETHTDTINLEDWFRRDHFCRGYHRFVPNDGEYYQLFWQYETDRRESKGKRTVSGPVTSRCLRVRYSATTGYSEVTEE